MDAEDLLKDIPLDTQDEQQDVQQESKRERLSAIVARGGNRQYLVRELQLSDIDKMTPQQLDKLYCRYEARLGANMTKSFGNSFMNLCVMGVSKYFNVINPPKLLEDLEEDPFINHALTSVRCELYYKYGMYLALFTAMLTTAKHINLNKNKNAIDKIETQEIPKAQEPQKTHEPKTEEPQTEEPQRKVKNPIRVAAGKKGAEVRWNKQKQAQQAQQGQQAQQAQAEHESIRITKGPPERPQTVNVNKNFFPLSVLIRAVGVGIFMIYGRKTEMQPKMQPKIQPEITQRPTDPFEMR